ncbi:PREDICTED: patellin-3-like [Ipomoea nil]|uniref:patellin-3-like n=1 Tax=Ipomoea nil TaxID=35883 RepID=UPI000900BE8C|nr:PREDICTED: patellin-3-like [Ipomoea nil]
MAHEEAVQVQKPAEEVVVVAEVSSGPEKPLPANVDSVPVPESEMPPEKEGDSGEETAPKDSENENMKEETTIASELPETHKKALQEFRKLVQDALRNHEFSDSPPKEDAKTKTEEKKTIGSCIEKEDTSSEPSVQSEESQTDDGAKTVEAIAETIIAVSTSEDAKTSVQSNTSPENQQPEEAVSIWGIKLMEDDKTDVILLKFLQARDFKVKEALTMLKNTINWRKEFKIEELLEEDLETGSEWERVVFMHGHSKDGHPVCYNVYGHFQNKDLYTNTFSDEEKRQRFLRWRIQFLEKSIRKLEFTPGGISTIVQVNDLNNSPGPAKWELRQATKQALHLLQDNYPEFLAKQVFINVPWWYLAVSRMTSPFLTQRTKSKFVFAGPSKSAETLFKYIAAEQVPIQYGGLSKDGEFGTADSVTEITVKPSAKHIVEFPVTQKCILTWEMRVVGWEVSYGAEFVPSAEDGYTVIIQKLRKFGNSACEEQVVCNSFKITEPGKVVLTIDNHTSKKKKLLYRLKAKPSLD